VDQPLVEVDGREVDKMLFHLPTMAWFTAATLPLLLSFTRNSAYTRKEEIQYVQTMKGTQFPKD
jgi:hypothetical protein